MKRYGTPDGQGRYGILDTDDEGLLICHECGKSWRHLATHARSTHGLTAAEYRERHGLGYATVLVAPAVSSKMRQSWQQNSAAHLAALESSRDPARARATSPVGHPGRRGTSRPEVLAGYQQRARRRRGRDLTVDEAALLGAGLDLQAWSDAARLLLNREGITTRSLAVACDIAPATVAQRLRRYPGQE